MAIEDNETLDMMLSELRDELVDGQDLALAIRLVGDVFGRRVKRAQSTLTRLEDLAADGGSAFGLTDEQLVKRIEILKNRTADFEIEMRRLSDLLATLAHGYDRELTELVDEVDEAT